MSPTSPNVARPHRTRARTLSVLAAAALLAAAGCGSDDPVTVGTEAVNPGVADTTVDDGTSASVPESAATSPETTDPVTTTDAPPATAEATTTSAPSTTSSTPSTDTTTTAPSSTTTTIDGAGAVSIAAAQAVADTDRGVLVDDGSDTWSTVVFEESSGRGLALLIDDTVVYQPAEPNDVGTRANGFAVIDDDGAELYGEAGRSVTLFDVGHVDGAATILAGSAPMAANFGAEPGELVLIDVETRDRTVLSEFDSFEGGIDDARFGDGAISILSVASAGSSLQIRELDGTSRHLVTLPSDTGLGLLDFDDAVWVLDPRFVGDDLAPVLGTRQYDLATAESRTVDLELVEDGVSIGAGFCSVADFVDGRIVCDRSQASPISIDVDTATVTAVPNIDVGTVRFRASQ